MNIICDHLRTSSGATIVLGEGTQTRNVVLTIVSLTWSYEYKSQTHECVCVSMCVCVCACVSVCRDLLKWPVDGFENSSGFTGPNKHGIS